MNAARQPLPEPIELLLVADAWCDAKSVCDAVAQEIEHPAKRLRPQSGSHRPVAESCLGH
jgi:hypothetical protein